MDSGLHAPNVKSLSELYHEGLILPSSKLSANQKLGIMKQLFIFEMMWYNGYSVSQTLWTCMYLLQPLILLDDNILRCYCFLLLKRCARIRNVLIKAAIFEEEDFSPLLYGINLDEKIDDSNIKDAVLRAEKELQVHDIFLLGKNVPQDFIPFSDNNEEEKIIVNALHIFLQYSKESLELQQLFDKPLTGLNNVKKKVIAIENKFLPLLKGLSNVGEMPENVFQQNISKRLFPDTHPRRVDYFDFEQSFNKYAVMLEHMKLLCTLPSQNSITKLEYLLLEMGRLKVDIVIRSRFIEMFYREDKIFGQHSVKDYVIKNGMETFEIPIEYFEETPEAEKFLNLASKSFIQMIKCYALSHARRRRKLSQLIMEWEFIIAESDKADIAYSKKHDKSMKESPHYFFFWMIDKLLSFMIMFLKLGFDLDIYDSHEYYIIFWYIHCLQAQRRNYANYLFQYTQKQIEKLNTSNTNTTKKKGKSKGKKVQKPSTLPSSHFLQIEAELQISLGLLRFFALLSKTNKLEQPTFPFGDPEKRFLCRFELFQRLSTPDPLEYNQFVQLSNQLHNLKIEDIIRAAAESFKASKDLIQQVIHHKNTTSHYQANEFKELEKVVQLNSNYLSNISKKKLFNNDMSTVTYEIMSDYIVINLTE